MDGRQLRCFLTVAGHLSFSRAAEVLGMTQPGVSYQIASLERTLGVTLFVRRRHGVALSSAGTRLLGDLRQLCAEFNGVVARCRALPGEVGCDEVLLPDLHQLKCFLALAHRQNLARAGADVFLTPSGVSYQVSLLERTLGRKLFRRSVGGILPTEAGELLLASVEPLLLGFEDAMKALQALPEKTGSLQIGFLGGAEMRFLPSALKTFSRAFPGVSVRTAYIPLARMFDSILAGEIDCGFTMLFDHAHPASIRVQVLAEERMMAVMAADHPLAGRNRLRLTELKDQALVSLCPELAGPGIEWHRALLARHGIDFGLAEFVPDFPTLLLAIEMGRGISIQPRPTTEEHGNTRLRYVALDAEGIAIEFAAAWRSERTNPYLSPFLGALGID